MNPAASRFGTTSASMSDFIEQGVIAGKIEITPLPALAMKILEMSNDEEVGARALAEVIENEPAVATAVLRIANSATFAGMKTLSHVEQAVSRLGMREVACVATAVMHRTRFVQCPPRRSGLFERMWQHSVTVALAARRIAIGVSIDPAEAFLAGLLHDVGRLLVFAGVDAYERAHRGAEVPDEMIEELMELLHARLGHRVLGAWRMAPGVCDVVLRHHETPRPEDRLLATVQVAESMAHKMGASLHPDPGLDLMHIDALEVLHFDELELAEIMVDIEDELARVRGLF